MHRTPILIAVAALAFAVPAAAQDSAEPAPPDSDASTEAEPEQPAETGSGAVTTGNAEAAQTPATTPQARARVTSSTESSEELRAPRREHPATPDPDAEAGCTHQEAPVFDPGSPRLEISAGGGYAAYFVTWRSISDFMTEGREADGLWQGAFFRGEIAFALGSLSISALYTHVFADHDGMVNTAAGQRQSLQFQWLTAEIGLQCACHDSTYVWNFGVEGGYDLANGSMMIGLEHRSLWYLWEGLFIGFDFDVAVLVGFPFTDSTGRPGPSGGGFETSLFVGYAIG